jgi:hypothetical protein
VVAANRTLAIGDDYQNGNDSGQRRFTVVHLLPTNVARLCKKHLKMLKISTTLT